MKEAIRKAGEGILGLAETKKALFPTGRITQRGVKALVSALGARDKVKVAGAITVLLDPEMILSCVLDDGGYLPQVYAKLANIIENSSREKDADLRRLAAFACWALGNFFCLCGTDAESQNLTLERLGDLATAEQMAHGDEGVSSWLEAICEEIEVTEAICREDGDEEDDDPEKVRVHRDAPPCEPE